MRTCHYRDYDLLNQSDQLYILCKYIGWHVGNSKVGVAVAAIIGVEQEQTTFRILQNSQTVARSARLGQQSLSAGIN